MCQHCCDELKFHLENREVAIIYVPEFREYGIKIMDMDGGISFQEIYYCPWCGQKLPPSLRDQWFDQIEALGYEWGDSNIPARYLSDEWWRERVSENGPEIFVLHCGDILPRSTPQ